MARLGLAAGSGPRAGADLGVQLTELAVDALLGEAGGGWAWVLSGPESRLHAGGAPSAEPSL